MTYDLALRDGYIVDGTGSPWYRADLAIVGARIAAMGRDLAGGAGREIDASGLVVSPGFVDMHAHSDVTLLINPRAESAVRQGVTTQIVGHCGFSAAPVQPENRAALRRDSFIFDFEGYDWTWNDMAGYRAALARARPAINVATLVGHGALRQYAMGQAARPAAREEMAVMRAELEKALEQGARGLSSGLTYAPGRFSHADELIELGKVMRCHGGIYHTHMRDYSRFILGAMGEAIRVGEESALPVNISHLNPPKGERRVSELTALIEEARGRGVQVTFDNTIWTRGGGPYMQMLPDWAQEGGIAAMKERLADPVTRHEIAHQLEEGAPNWQGWTTPDWEDALIARTGRREHDVWCGRTIADLAAERGLPPAEAALVLLLEDDGQFWTAPTIKLQDDLNQIISHPLSVPISDGFALAPHGPLSRPTMPRSYGTFPRILGRYARDWGILPMETAVQKMTSLPAQRMGLMDRGLLRPGLYADITVFDPKTVLDRETYQDPHTFPSGIEYVLVNGQLVVDGGRQTEACPGQVL
jgi:N-acyl-D-aspartate/D-glutamate deacylase